MRQVKDTTQSAAFFVRRKSWDAKMRLMKSATMFVNLSLYEIFSKDNFKHLFSALLSNM